MGPKDQILPCLEILSQKGVDVAPVRALLEESETAAPSPGVGTRITGEQKALEATALLMQKTFAEEMAPLKSKASKAKVRQVEAQVEEAQAKAKQGRLMDAVDLYRQALDALKGG